MIYQFRTGNVYQGVTAQIAGEELERIRLANDGKLLTENVLENASSLESPIHGVFTWDDAKAAHEHRMQEARLFIRSVVVVQKSDDVPQPAYWNIQISTQSKTEGEESERYYQASSVIASSPVEYASALNGMLRELVSAQTGLEKLRHLAPRGKKMKVDRASKLLESAHEALV